MAASVRGSGGIALGPKSAPSDALEKCATVFVFLLASTGLLMPLFQTQNGTVVNASEGDPVTQAVWLLVYLVVSLLFLVRWRYLIGVALRDKLLLLLTALAIVSVLWSVAPDVTVRRGVALIGTSLFGVYLAGRFGEAEMLRLLAWTLGLAAVLSLIFAVALPSYGISQDPITLGDWKGIFDHKNTLGKNMALGTIVFLLLAFSSRRYRWVAWTGLGLSLALLILSKSTTGLVVVLGVAILLPFYRVLRREVLVAVPLVLLALLLVGGVAAWFLLGNTDTVLGLVGKDATLTGRTVLWSAVLDAIRDRPWTGYGYSAFWLGWEGKSAAVWLVTGEEFYDAHNGILDLWLTLGLVGVSVFALNFVRAFGRAIAWARATGTVVGLWPIAFLSFMLLSNLTEGTILQQNNLSWILYVATVLRVAAPSRNRFAGAFNAPGPGDGGKARQPVGAPVPRRPTLR
jgi:exopolysaccharide production protein ExoQ